MVPPPTLPRKKRTTATRICKVEGCTKGIRSRGLCKAHGGGRRCTTPGCTTSDQGGGHCVLHGGGRRCRIEGCKKSAQWRGVCKMHGGARRCRYGQCTKNGQVKQGYCRMHHNLLTAQRQQQEQLQAQQLQQLQQAQLPPVPAVAAVPSPLTSWSPLLLRWSTPSLSNVTPSKYGIKLNKYCDAVTAKASIAASAGSHDDQLANKTSCDSTWTSSSAVITRKGTSSGFRKLREALMARKFESHDNIPVAVGAVPGLFIGSYGAANNLEALKTTGITHVLCVSPTLPLNFPDVFTYLQLQVADLSSVRISDYFDDAFGFIDRSSTVILAYLIARWGFSLADALCKLRRVRPQVQPNSGFYRELVALEAKQNNSAS
ncbi:Dual specificity protein phosphatase 1 [Phytophthora nicotianae]|uniref:Dual specificity protein phosphatase 1 n=1 Tax=Phytophthora nicotianae TaxID=4792 RepID=A0A0W8D1U7_PHYNI|nr:Dual specificity protein phosphatase 1 [Phytophthora nicotianae]